MEIPKLFYGTYAEVKKKFTAVVKHFRKNGSLDLSLFEDLLNTDTNPAMIYVDGYNRYDKKEKNYYLSVIMPVLVDEEVFKSTSSEFYYSDNGEEIIRYLMTTSWGVLGMLPRFYSRELKQMNIFDDIFYYIYRNRTEFENLKGWLNDTRSHLYSDGTTIMTVASSFQNMLMAQGIPGNKIAYTSCTSIDELFISCEVPLPSIPKASEDGRGE